jgi:hypothetical protein
LEVLSKEYRNVPMLTFDLYFKVKMLILLLKCHTYYMLWL